MPRVPCSLCLAIFTDPNEIKYYYYSHYDQTYITAKHMFSRFLNNGHFVTCHFIITLMRKIKVILWLGHCLCEDCLFSLFSCVFSGDSGFLQYPKDVRVRWMVCLNKCVNKCECECVLRWKSTLSRVGSHLLLLTARPGSFHPWPWTGISRLENNFLNWFYSSFLNVCMAHIYSNV